MLRKDDEVGVTMEGSGSASKLTWLIAGVGIGAVAAILLAPQSGEDTRDWISTKCHNGIDTAKEKVKRARWQLGDAIDQGQELVTDTVNAGREALEKGITEAGF